MAAAGVAQKQTDEQRTGGAKNNQMTTFLFTFLVCPSRLTVDVRVPGRPSLSATSVTGTLAGESKDAARSNDVDEENVQNKGEQWVGLICAKCKCARVARSPTCCGGDDFVEIGSVTVDQNRSS